MTAHEIEAPETGDQKTALAGVSTEMREPTIVPLDVHEHVFGLIVLIHREGAGEALGVGSERDVFANVGGTDGIAVLVPTDGVMVQALTGMADALPDAQAETCSIAKASITNDRTRLCI